MSQQTPRHFAQSGSSSANSGRRPARFRQTEHSETPRTQHRVPAASSDHAADAAADGRTAQRAARGESARTSQPKVRPSRAASRSNTGNGRPSTSNGRSVQAAQQRSIHAGVAGSQPGGHVIKKSRRRRRRALRTTILVLLLFLIVGVGVVGWSAYSSAKTIKAKAQSATTALEQMQTDITASKFDSIDAQVTTLLNATSTISSELNKPVWSLVSLVPVYGEDITNARRVMSTVNTAGSTTLEPMVKALVANPPSSLISDGVINVKGLNELVNKIATVAPQMQQLTDELEDASDFHIEQVQTQFTKIKDKLTGINTTMQYANSFAPFLGTLLGDGSTRTYLLASLNSAELRASGGFPGSLALVHITNGKIEIDDFTNPYEGFTGTVPSSLAPSDEELTLFGDQAKTTRDIGFNPDFLRIAQVWAQSYMLQNDVQIDGVIGMTPAMVQRMLQISGKITLSDGTELDGSNATKVLQHDLYWEYLSEGKLNRTNARAVDALFAEAAGKALKSVMGNLSSSNLTKFMSAVFEGSTHREFMLFLTNPDEEARIEPYGMSGSLPNNPQKPQVGVFMSIYTSSKLGWYLDADTRITNRAANADGTTTYTLTTTFTNTSTKQELANAGDYIAPVYYNVVGNMVPFVTLYAPAGGTINLVSATNTDTDEEIPMEKTTYDGLEVLYIPGKGTGWEYNTHVAMGSGQALQFDYTVTTAAGADELTVMSMPTLTAYRIAS